MGLPFHLALDLNDGFYGNSNSWIIGSGDPDRVAGVLLGATVYGVTHFAWSRDNGNGAFDDSSPGTDCCGGQADDRWSGLYTLQFTWDGGSNWTTIGTLDYVSNDDVVPGGGFTGYFRHEYEVSLDGGAPVPANGLRLLVSPGSSIDEVEVYALPEPVLSVPLICMIAGLLSLSVRSRQSGADRGRMSCGIGTPRRLTVG